MAPLPDKWAACVATVFEDAVDQCSATPRAKRVRTRTPSTRAARARALFLKNAVLHASTRAHACARAVFENNEFFQLYEPWPTYYLEHEKIILELRNSVILNVRIIVLTYLKLFRVTKLSQNCIGRMKTNC